MRSQIQSNLAVKDVESLKWNAVVIGAGPAGAMAARELALQGASVLLVDKAKFPRTKVCGCCLNGSALKTLEQAGLKHVTASALSLAEMKLLVNGIEAKISLADSVVLSRQEFDSNLVECAIAAGVYFLPQTQATVGEIDGGLRGVSLNVDCLYVQARADVVVVADGLSGRSLALQKGFEVLESRDSRIGAGAIVQSPDSYAPGTIYMACGRGGYVGLVRLEDGRLDIAAAFDRQFTRQSGGPAAAAAAILSQCQLEPIAGLDEVSWRGTESLTRSRVKLAGERVFVIGDSAGYAEPFTGEGMAWALLSAKMVSPLVLQGIEKWDSHLSGKWIELHARLIGRRQKVSRIISWTLRKIELTRLAAKMVSHAPILASPVVRYLNAV